MRATVSIRSFFPLLILARKKGYEPAEIFRGGEITPAMLGQPDLRVPSERFARALVRAAASFQDPAFGLRAAHAVDFLALGAFAQPSEFLAFHLLVSSGSVGEALSAVVLGLQIAFGASGGSFARREGEGVITYEPPESEPSIVTEHIVALFVCALRRVSARPFAPREVWFRHPAPAHVDAHTELLAPNVRFGADSAGFVVAEADMAIPLVTSDPRIHEALEERITRVLRELANFDFAASVREIIAREIPDGNPLAENVAAQLGMSIRTLARHLSAQGTTHQALLDSVRMGLAARYLREKRPVTQVSRLVGFSALSAFHRAFRRWYGCSPAEWMTGDAPDGHRP